MFAIASASFKEAVRKKLFYLVGLVTLIYLVLFSLVTYFYARDINENFNGNAVKIYMLASQVISVLGFYFSSMLLAFLTIVASVSSISQEVENGTIHSIITKPIKRWEYVLGKYSGLAVLLAGYSTLLYFSILIICYFTKLPLVTRFEPQAVLKGLAFFILQPIALLSLSTFGSASFKTLTNGIFVVAFYILGLIGGMMEQIGSMLNNTKAPYFIGIFTSLLSPFDIIYRQMNLSVFSSVGIANPFAGPAGLSSTLPSKWMILYIFAYVIGLVLLAIRNFNRKDIP